jgi:IclR family transcriptional regulator, KDG regulon repressor
MDKTLIKGLAMLEVLVRSDMPRGVAELAREMGLQRSNVHRTLQTLQSCGYVSAKGSMYFPTMKIWELGSLVIGRLDIKQVAGPVLATLTRQSGESVHLSLLDRDEVIYIDKLEGTHPVRAYSQIGGRAPCFCVATGKVLLAFQPDETANRVLAGGLIRYTSRTIVDRELLLRELIKVRANGYAVNRGEWREGVWGVAAPISDATGAVIAALGVSGPANRYQPKALRTLIPLVCAAARDVSIRMGSPMQREGVPA